MSMGAKGASSRPPTTPGPTPWEEATFALSDLRDAMEKIKLYSPFVRPGHEPSAADACAQVILALEHNIRMIEVYLGPRPGPQPSKWEPDDDPVLHHHGRPPEPMSDEEYDTFLTAAEGGHPGRPSGSVE